MVLGLGEEAIRRGFSSSAKCSKTPSPVWRSGRAASVGLETGFYDWDRMTQGLVPGNLIIVAGRPGMGKTSFAINDASTWRSAARSPRPSSRWR